MSGLRFNCRRRSDNALLAKVRIEHMISGSELGDAIAIVVYEDDVSVDDVTKTRALEVMREQFTWFGEPQNWSDLQGEDRPEIDYEACAERARELWPEAFND